MAANRNKSGFYINFTCPGCGGELEIESDFFVLTCSHCGSALRIVMPDVPPAYLVKCEKTKREIRRHVDRYLKQNSLPLTGSDIEIRSIYYPYWKIDAVILKVRNKIIERYTGREDSYNQEITFEQKRSEIRLTPYTTTQAAGSIHESIPYSIGMRTQYIRMVPFSKENIREGFACQPVMKTWPQALEDLNKAVSTLGTMDIADFGVNKTELFHPTGSVVYFPYFIVESPHDDRLRQFVADGITGRVLNYTNENVFDEEVQSVNDPQLEFGELGVEFHRCTNCGFDLPGKQSFVYICENCHKLILLERLRFAIDDITMALADTRQSDRLFPFWAMKISEADRARLGTMFGGIHGSDQIVIPAFKVPNFEAMYRLSKRISAALPKINLVPAERLDEHFMRVNVSLSEALTLAEVIIYREMAARGRKVSAGESEFNPMEVSLFYAPFHPQSYFYVDSILGAVTFEKSLIG